MNTGDALRIAELAVAAMQVISQVTKFGGDKAKTALAAIGGLTRAFSDAENGVISIEDLEAEVAKLASSIVTDISDRDRIIDKKLSEKFAKNDED